MQHPAGHLVPTAGTACSCPHPWPLKGKSKNFLGASQCTEKEERCLLPRSLFQANSNCLTVASEAEAIRPVTHAGSMGIPGDSSCRADAEPGQPAHPPDHTARSCRRDVGHSLCTWVHATPKLWDAETQLRGRHYAGPLPLQPLVPQPTTRRDGTHGYRLTPNPARP